MSRDIAEYVALALIRQVDRGDDYFSTLKRVDFSGDFSQLRDLAVARCGFSVSDDTLKKAIRTLADWHLLRVTDDAYSGTFYKIWAERLSDTLKTANKQVITATESGLKAQQIPTQRADYPLASALIQHPVFEDYQDHGEPWLDRALGGLRARIDSGDLGLDQTFPGLSYAVDIPASDRIVKLDHNQASELEHASNNLIEAVSGQNEIDGREGLRELIVGQLKAGRELFRAGCVRVYLVQVALVDILKFLAKRYEKEAIGALASALLAALVNHFGSGL